MWKCDKHLIFSLDGECKDCVLGTRWLNLKEVNVTYLLE